MPLHSSKQGRCCELYPLQTHKNECMNEYGVLSIGTAWPVTTLKPHLLLTPFRPHKHALLHPWQCVLKTKDDSECLRFADCATADVGGRHSLGVQRGFGQRKGLGKRKGKLNKSSNPSFQKECNSLLQKKLWFPAEAEGPFSSFNILSVVVLLVFRK